jgi:hypothetical protein
MFENKFREQNWLKGLTVEKYVTSKQDYSEIPIYGFFLGQ